MSRFLAAAPRTRALAAGSVLLLTLGLAISAPAAQAEARTAAHALRPGQSLLSGAHLVSPSGRSVLEVSPSGALVRRTASGATWTSRTTTTAAKAAGSSLRFDRRGRLVLERRDGRVVWRAPRLADATRVTLSDGGALTLLAGSRTLRVIAPAAPSAPTVQAPTVPPTPSLTSPAQLTPEQQLRAGERLTSQNGRFRLTMQHDGNLVLEGPSGPVWTTRTAVGSDASVTMQPDGNLVLHDTTGQPRWATRTAIPGSFLVLQDDGDLVVYSPAGSALWASKTGGRS